jgi:hypothetical protein
MRSPKLTSALAATAALALAPAGALAAKHHHSHTVKNGISGHGCRVTLHVENNVVTSGESALAYGVGSCGSTPSAGQPVTLFSRQAGASGFSTAGTATTDSNGGYQIPTGALTFNTGFYAVIGNVHSVERQVKTQALVTATEPKALLALATGKVNAVTFTGTVAPAPEGGEVILERQNLVRGVGWGQISKPVKIGPKGEYSIRHVFRIPGTSNIRVLLRRSTRNVASVSNELSFLISQAQNPALTLESEEDPLPFEGGTNLHGVASGAANTAITLFARTVGGHFAPIAAGTTDPQGKYAFPVKPSASMLYQVEAAGHKSRVLYEGVKYVLTAAPPATVQSGQQLVITGTVSPVKANHPILLQKKNAQGPGFHTIGKESKVEPDGKFTISEPLFVPGAYTLRVKVPGDPENGAAATAPFTVTVTPVPPASIPAAGTP